MPVHDWTRVDAGLFHSFHQRRISVLCDALNTGGLPPEYLALAEQSIRGPIPEVLSPRPAPAAGPPGGAGPAVAVADAPPRVSLIQVSEVGVYARKADRVTVRHRHGQVVAVIELVSPGNKAGVSELRAFVEKTADLTQQGVHVLVVDLFPPGKRDPHGLHKAIWDQFQEEGFEPPAGRPLTLASYSAGAVKTAYVESVGVGDELPAMPLFLEPEVYVPVPLEATYRASWEVFPRALKGLLEAPPAPTSDPHHADPS